MLDAQITGNPGDASKEHLPMTQARHADSAFPLSTISMIGAALAAVVLVGAVAVATLAPQRLDLVADDPITVSPAVIASAQQWELERRQQYGYVDPVLESGEQWERERRQYDFVAPIFESGDRWEEERRQQSPN